MIEYLVLLIKFNMPAHHDHGLAHKKEKEATKQGEEENDNATENDDLARGKVCALDIIDECVNQTIIIGLHGLWAIAWKIKGPLHKVDNESSYLRCKYVEVIRKENKKYPASESNAVFPEIFIDLLKMTHLKLKI